MKNRKPSSINQGIQGNVQAEVVAVGKKAKAIKNVPRLQNLKEIEAAVGDLRKILENLSLHPPVKQAVLDDVDSLTAESRSKHANKDRIGNLLAGLSEKLKLSGVVLTESIGLGETIRKIAEMVQLSLKALGGLP